MTTALRGGGLGAARRSAGGLAVVAIYRWLGSTSEALHTGAFSSPNVARRSPKQQPLASVVMLPPVHGCKPQL